MSTSNEEPDRPAAHVDNATIEVRQAELYMTPGARRAAHRLAWAVVVLFAFTLATLGISLAFTAHQASVNSCQRAVNSRFQQAEIDRAVATRESAQAQIDLWAALLALHGTQAQKLAQFNRAFVTYKEKLHQVTGVRFPAQTGAKTCNS